MKIKKINPHYSIIWLFSVFITTSASADSGSSHLPQNALVAEDENIEKGFIPPSKTSRKSTSIDDISPVVLSVNVNGKYSGETTFLKSTSGEIYAKEVDLREWRLKLSDNQFFSFNGESYYSLNKFPNLTYELNLTKQEISFSFPISSFESTKISLDSSHLLNAQKSNISGAYVNYDLTYSKISNLNSFDGLLETAYFNQFGAADSNFLLKNINSNAKLIRLETNWTRDFQESMKTLVIGDSIGSSDIWSRPVRFGGIKYGTNFATNPQFVTFPLPQISGAAIVPSATDLYIDGIKRQSLNIPAGPFELSSLPVLTGKGEIQLVENDMLGRQTVITVPYYASTQLLKADLVDESYEAGFVRNDFGINSNDYGRFVSSAQIRKGFTDYLTGEGRVEFQTNQLTSGIGASYGSGAGVLSGACALSYANSSIGHLINASYDYQAHGGLSYGARAQWASEDFKQIGLLPNLPVPALLFSSNIGYGFKHYGSVQLGYMLQNNRQLENNEVVSAGYNLSVGKTSSINLTGFRTLSGMKSYAINLTFTIGFENQTSMSTNINLQSGGSQEQVQIQHDLPVGNGFGYKLIAGHDRMGTKEEANVSMQNNNGTYSLDATHIGQSNSYRAIASGGVSFIDNDFFFSRRINDSFAIAKVADFDGVDVLLNNQPYAMTNKHGVAVIPQLLPYQTNKVRVDTSQLPFDTQIESEEVDVVPLFRSGSIIEFPISRLNGALLTITTDDGVPIKAGSTVKLSGSDEAFEVAQRGQVYLTGLKEKNHLTVSMEGKSCEIIVSFKKTTDPIPKLGPFSCSMK